MGGSMEQNMERITGFPARYWHTLENGEIQCDLCPRFCKLKDGQRGLCFVRARVGDEIVLTTYGRSSGFCIDPIEKKPLNHFLPGTPVLSFGTAGCNLACKFCQNWDISKSREMDRLMDQASPEQIAQVALETACRSVAFTYNDPTIFLEYAVDVADACRERGIKNVAVTAGYICKDPREEFFSKMDAANIDLKSFSQTFYRELTGADLQPILDTIEYLCNETDVWVELTTLLIPGKNDSDRELHQLCDWIREKVGPEVPLHFSAFHPDFRMQDIPATPKQTLIRAHRIAHEEGLSFVYIGNRLDVGGQDTLCPHCGHLLIQRFGYEILGWGLDPKGHCEECGLEIPGVFEAKPGKWGSRRQPVRVSQ
jgi:pyruvate formate lyase activating enzyme